MKNIYKLILLKILNYNNIKDIKNNKKYFLSKKGYINKKINYIYKNKNINNLKTINNIKKKIFFIFNFLNKKYIINIHKNKKINTINKKYKNKKGNIHPITISCNKIKEIFNLLGFKEFNSPEIENEYINFTLLNSPKNHPSRSLNDTFYINIFDKYKKNLLLRTHMSSMQIRYMKFNKIPIKIFSIGKVYRRDNDLTHSPMFHQVEVLYLDKNINISNFKAIYLKFLKLFFNKKKFNIKFRISYFPFTIPSLETDIYFKKGIFKKKWIEISGGGLVHPKILKKLKFKNISGFAFGVGIERITMFKYNINNINLFYKNNLKFLKNYY
ncbi:putative phenylalanyl-tRNA synthetase, alpha subunit [Candidatus Zinderia insecticola CARI]|uniref:phenylalanine--tRNA ligase n=1 Tax=Zinderia insecticola (strain CARI) TaxID=871271 RepID=E0TIM8_ZINIC|nr:putative phenylalanyl-tRNA synthetase, alpha subunit [Candidatus Zinderia insecticola CARI]